MNLMRGKDITRAIGMFGPTNGPSNGPSNVFAPHQNHKGQSPYIINRFISNFMQMRTEELFQGPNTLPERKVKFTLHPDKTGALRNRAASRKCIIYVSDA